MLGPCPFADRAHAGGMLGDRLRDEHLRNPVVLAIPRGGIEVGLPIAKALGAELDVVLSRKLRDPSQPELALGAVSESGEVYLSGGARYGHDDAIEEERRYQVGEIERRRRLFRAVRPAVSVAGRSVILTDDGIATGSTMMAALRTIAARRPHEIIVAVPVAPPDRLREIGSLCDRVVCLLTPEGFRAVGQYYDDFCPVSDERVLEALREAPTHE